jgi:tetratricopeptide (TPR) repeat protein
MRTSLALASILVTVGACAPSWEVVRVMDGQVVTGRFIEPDAYSAFLRGAMAEEAGQLPVALVAYTSAAARDGDDPEIWTRIGDVRCAMSQGDPMAGEAFGRALGLDPSYAPALAGRARCAVSRGEQGAALADEKRAAAADPLAIRPDILLAEALSKEGHAEASRDRLVALTLLHGTSPVAWDALAAWGTSHGDAMLVSRALAEVARLVPARKAELAGRAAGLAGDGQLAAARALAAVLVDAPGDRSSGGEGPAPSAMPLVARLAVDEALVKGDADAARRRAIRSHIGLDVLAGRAVMVGDAALASALAEEVILADPKATGARMILATAAHRLGNPARVALALDSSRLGEPRGARMTPEALLPFARLVERASSPDTARRVLEGWAPLSLLAGDALVTPVAVDLAALGALRDDALPLDARIELAARRSEPMPAVDASSGELDARHRLFAWAVQKPLEETTLDLARRLAPAAAHDSLVAVALARLSLAAGHALAPGALDPILAVDPGDPILAAAALDLAKRSGDAQAIAPARARLTALARTAGERARALE